MDTLPSPGLPLRSNLDFDGVAFSDHLLSFPSNSQVSGTYGHVSSLIVDFVGGPIVDVIFDRESSEGEAF